MLELAHLIARYLGHDTPTLEFSDDRLGQVVRHIADGGKARKLLDFEPEVDLEVGLERTIDWYAGHRAAWERMISMRRVPVKLRDGKVVWY